MSFPVVCPTCGAPSGPSTGVCPFCKSVVAPKSRKDPAGGALALVKRFHREGNLPRALELCTSMAAEKPKLLENVEFLLLSAKILLEAEAPSTRIRGLLGKAFALEPENAEVADYLELVEAKSLLSQEKDDAGETRLGHLLRRSPDNPHALFILGAHLFWSSKDRVRSIRHLERCVRLAPAFLRAWGCLGAIYESLGNPHLAKKAYRQCVSLETEPGMKRFFKQRADAIVA